MAIGDVKELKRKQERKRFLIYWDSEHFLQTYWFGGISVKAPWVMRYIDLEFSIKDLNIVKYAILKYKRYWDQ